MQNKPTSENALISFSLIGAHVLLCLKIDIPTSSRSLCSLTNLTLKRELVGLLLNSFVKSGSDNRETPATFAKELSLT